METKIEVKISAPELVDAIRVLAETLGQVKGLDILKESKEANSKKEENHEDKRPVTLEEVRSKLSELSKLGKLEQVKALIERFGGSKLTEVPEEKYGEILREVGRW